jgi:hypothetical protein
MSSNQLLARPLWRWPCSSHAFRYDRDVNGIFVLVVVCIISQLTVQSEHREHLSFYSLKGKNQTGTSEDRKERKNRKLSGHPRYRLPHVCRFAFLFKVNSYVSPQYLKFMLKLTPQEGSVGDEPIELAFVDCKYQIPSLSRFSR